MGESMAGALARGASVTIHRTEAPDENAIEVLTKWLVWWQHNVTPAFAPFGDIDADDVEDMARCLAQALCAPDVNGPLANPEFVSRLPGSSVVHAEVRQIKLTRE